MPEEDQLPGVYGETISESVVESINFLFLIRISLIGYLLIMLLGVLIAEIALLFDGQVIRWMMLALGLVAFVQGIRGFWRSRKQYDDVISSLEEENVPDKFTPPKSPLGRLF
jgi:hypothetical protein